MASSARVVCWQNREEWLHVYRALYSFDDPEIQRKGVERVAAWRSRSAGKLPLAIECTSNLVSAQLVALDKVGEVQSRLTLAMAIVRFVNGMVDQVQKGKFARSVQSIADEIGLPDWLVDLRHEATHASLPSMETLQSGLHVSLSWLQGEYWQAQINIHEDNEEKLSQLLKEYRDVALSQVLNRKKTAKLKGSGKKVKEISDEITNVVSMSNLWSLLPNILSCEGMMIPSCEQLNTLGIKWLSENSPSETSISDVPKEMIKMWKTLLETLDISSSQFIIFFVIHLLEKLSDVCDSQTQAISHGYAAWIKYLMQEQSKKEPLLMRSKFPWLDVLQVTLENLTVYSLELIPLILENSPLVSRDMKKKIQHLVSVFFNLECDQLDDVEESLPSDLEQWMANRKNTSANESKEDNPPAGQGWQVSQGSTQWHLIPFGEVLGTSDKSPKNLQLSQTSSDRFCIESGTEDFIRTENDEVMAGYSNETIVYDSNNDDDMSSDLNSDQSGRNMQDSESVEIIVGADHELSELSYSEAIEEKNDITSISDQIYLF